MALIEGLLQELEQEADTTRRVLERVPNNRLTLETASQSENTWRTGAARRDGARRRRRARRRAVAGRGPAVQDPLPASTSELIPALDDSIAKARRALGAWTTRP